MEAVTQKILTTLLSLLATTCSLRRSIIVKAREETMGNGVEVQQPELFTLMDGTIITVMPEMDVLDLVNQVLMVALRHHCLLLTERQR